MRRLFKTYFFVSALVVLFLISFTSGFAEYTANQKVKAREEKLSLELGNSLYQENKLEQALLVFHDFIALYPRSDRRSQVLEKIAKIYEQRQEYVLAQDIYSKLFEELGLSTKGLYYYLQEARLAEVMGNVSKAQSIYKVIIETLPNSSLALQAKRRIRLNRLFEE